MHPIVHPAIFPSLDATPHMGSDVPTDQEHSLNVPENDEATSTINEESIENSRTLSPISTSLLKASSLENFPTARFPLDAATTTNGEETTIIHHLEGRPSRINPEPAPSIERDILVQTSNPLQIENRFSSYTIAMKVIANGAASCTILGLVLSIIGIEPLGPCLLGGGMSVTIGVGLVVCIGDWNSHTRSENGEV
jgi:hypothetical protein